MQADGGFKVGTKTLTSLIRDEIKKCRVHIAWTDDKSSPEGALTGRRRMSQPITTNSGWTGFRVSGDVDGNDRFFLKTTCKW